MPTLIRYVCMPAWGAELTGPSPCVTRSHHTIKNVSPCVFEVFPSARKRRPAHPFFFGFTPKEI